MDAKELQHKIHLLDEDNKLYTGAHAVLKVLSKQPRYEKWYKLYERNRFFAILAEGVYAIIARAEGPVVAVFQSCQFVKRGLPCNTMEIIAYLKPSCGWSSGVRAIFKKYGLPYEDRDIINNPNYYMEMVQKSGQNLSPCVIVDGVMLPDISGEEVEQYMLSKGLIAPNNAEPDAPTNKPCAHEQRPDTSQTLRHF